MNKWIHKWHRKALTYKRMPTKKSWKNDGIRKSPLAIIIVITESDTSPSMGAKTSG